MFKFLPPIALSKVSDDARSEPKSAGLKYTMFLTSGVFVLSLLYLVMTSKIVSSIGFNISEKIENTSVQVLSAFSQGLFVNYIYAFELIALILTIIVVGITLFDKKEDK